MNSEKGFGNYLYSGFLILLILVVPALVGYDIFFQWNTPTMDFFLDDPGSSIVHSVVPDGKANAAGLKAGDVILTVDDMDFKAWYAPQIGRTHILKVERRGDQLSLPVPTVRVLELNYLNLISAILVALIYWGIGTLLFLRRFWNQEIRILFAISQAIAISVLFPLSFQSPWNPPYWGLLASKAGICFFAPAFFHYIITYPVKFGNRKARWIGLTVLYGMVPIFVYNWMNSKPWGQYAAILYVSVIVSVAVAIMVYVFQYRASPDGRRRTRIIVFGAFSAGIIPTTFYLLPRFLGSSLFLPEWAAGLFLVIAPISYLFATLHYNLFGIDRLVNRSLVYAVLSFGIFIIYLLPYLFLLKYLPNDLFFQIVVIFSLTLWIGWTFDWLRSRAIRIVDHLFYGGWYDYPVVVEKVSDSLVRCNSREQINDVLTKQVPRLMRLSNANLWISDPHARLPSLPPLKASFRYKFQTEIPAQWTVDAHPGGDELSEIDNRILHTLAQQAEISLNNAFTIEMLKNQLDEIRASREILAQTQRQLLKSREEERSRLARDLHDSPIQSLVGMNIQIGLLLNRKALNSVLKTSLSEMRSNIRQISDQLRQVCADLRPPMLDTLGLSSALRSLISEWTDQTGILVHTDICLDAEVRSIPGDVSVNIYRVAQEALSNIHKHAKAHNVRFSLIRKENQICMTIEDDGIGFNAPDTLGGLTAQSHYGLAGMRERIDLIGGKWSLASHPGKGTVVRVDFSTNGKLL